MITFKMHRSIAIGSLAVLLIAGVASAFDEPKGFGKVEFGMQPEAVLALHPDARLTMGGTPPPGKAMENLISYRLEKQAVGPMKDCRIDFRFYGARSELYEIQFVCPDREAIARYLTEQFGTPSRVTTSTLMWNGTRVAINFVPKSGAFSYGDIPRSRSMQLMLFRAMGMKLGENATPSPAKQETKPTEGAQ